MISHFMSGNGKKKRGMGLGSNIGQMVHFIMGNGGTIVQKGMGD